MVHAKEVVEAQNHIPVLVRLRDLLQLLGKYGPEDVVGEMKAFHQPDKLSLLQLVRVSGLACPEDELQEFSLAHM